MRGLNDHTGHITYAPPTDDPHLTHSSLPLLRAGSPFCNAHVADSLAGSAALRLVFPGQILTGPLDPPRCTKVEDKSVATGSLRPLSSLYLLTRPPRQI